MILDNRKIIIYAIIYCLIVVLVGVSFYIGILYGCEGGHLLNMKCVQPKIVGACLDSYGNTFYSANSEASNISDTINITYIRK